MVVSEIPLQQFSCARCGLGISHLVQIGRMWGIPLPVAGLQAVVSKKGLRPFKLGILLRRCTCNKHVENNHITAIFFCWFQVSNDVYVYFIYIVSAYLDYFSKWRAFWSDVY